MRFRRKSVALALAIVTCAGLATAAGLRGQGRLPPPKPRGAAPRLSPSEQAIASKFEAIRAQNQDLEYADLLKRLKIARRSDARPSFDPTHVAYYDKIMKALALTAEEQSIYARAGIVGVDHGQRTTMASAYLGIYHRDLPVLITTDSILHAMHRSFDAILIQIEMNFLLPTIKKLLVDTRAALQAEAPALGNAQVEKSAEDIDLYLTVALNLLDGNGITPSCDKGQAEPGCADEPRDGLLAHSEYGQQDAKVEAVLRAIAAGVESQDVPLYGRAGVVIDWSQFKPRGHYTKWPALRRYFRAMMWLGRVDVGFTLAPPSFAFGQADSERELRDAALLSLLIRRGSQVDALAAADRAVGFLVGLSDNTTVADILAAADKVGAKRPADLARPELLGAIGKAVAGKGQRIRSQIGGRPPGGGAEIPLPDVFQLFGQRFVIDSFITSKVVFDSILYKGNREERMMPVGLDVMAALGSDEAVALLQPELKTHHYAANLLAARQIVEARPAAVWDATQYDLWLSALTKLDDIPRGAFPEVMRSQAWARKQLQTQLGSWAELRHDTILYAKQSATMRVVCEYPTGYVEPYPLFYERVALFADQARKRLMDVNLQNSEYLTNFLERFKTTTLKLAGLARKELAGQRFDADEKLFIKETIKKETRGGGCGGPRITYTGWYPELIYGDPEEWEPTIADVHTGDGAVLEVGVGDVDYVVAAIDNRGDRAAYVGPIYSYYEFPSGERLTDEQWRERIKAGKLPPRPEWVHAFQAKPKRRNLLPTR